jgi:hypothetical protein
MNGDSPGPEIDVNNFRKARATPTALMEAAYRSHGLPKRRDGSCELRELIRNTS